MHSVMRMNVDYLAKRIEQINEVCYQFRPISERLLIGTINMMIESLGRVQSAICHEAMN